MAIPKWFLRNVLVASGNSGDRKLLPLVKAHLFDDYSLVRGMAVWALGQLSETEEFKFMKGKYSSKENDEEVLLEWETAPSKIE